jgi:hypothetical protein
VREERNELYHEELSDSPFKREGMQRRIDPALRLGGAEAGVEEEAGEEEAGQILHGRRIPNGGLTCSVIVLLEGIKIIVVECKDAWL